MLPKTTLPLPNDLLRQRPSDQAHYLKKMDELLKYRDPLANNPKMLIQHVYTLVRPDEAMAADFLWRAICKHYGITKEHSEKLRYIARVMSDSNIIEAHTHLYEPVFEREKQ